MDKTIVDIRKLISELRMLTTTLYSAVIFSERIEKVAEELKAIVDSDEFECDTHAADELYCLVTMLYFDSKSNFNVVGKAKNFKFLAGELTKSAAA